MREDERPCILHVIHHLCTGGMENGVVHRITLMPVSVLRHGVVCLEEYADFRERRTRPDVAVHAMDHSRISLWRLRRALNQSPLAVPPPRSRAGLRPSAAARWRGGGRAPGGAGWRGTPWRAHQQDVRRWACGQTPAPAGGWPGSMVRGGCTRPVEPVEKAVCISYTPADSRHRAPRSRCGVPGLTRRVVSMRVLTSSFLTIFPESSQRPAIEGV
jgi:hypothetical protein